jgi:hypothetical protein
MGYSFCVRQQALTEQVGLLCPAVDHCLDMPGLDFGL